MPDLYIPENYKPLLSVKETEKAIVLLKDFFQLALSTELGLTRVTAPLFVKSGTGINDDLNGVERPVKFPVKDMGDSQMEASESFRAWAWLRIWNLYRHECYPRGRNFGQSSFALC